MRCGSCGCEARPILNTAYWNQIVQWLQTELAKDDHYRVDQVEDEAQAVFLRSTEDTNKTMWKCGFCLELDRRQT
jgi:hypothetical protein